MPLISLTMSSIKITSLPRLDFTRLDIHPNLLSLPFALRIEAFRASQAKIGNVQDFATITDSSSLYRSLFPQVAKEPFLRSPRHAWEALAEDAAPGVKLSGRMQLNHANLGPLLELKVWPLSHERNSRFQRNFGWDRFLYIDVPSLDSRDLPKHLKGTPDQSKHLERRFTQWLGRPKRFLGRQWQAFHLQQNKSKNKSAEFKQERKYRVVFFATSGDGLKPMSIDQLVDWAVPLLPNSDQTYCKAFARIDLALSSTTPTVVFKWSQIKVVPDKISTETPESTDFNDTKLP